jgi:phosphoglycolate phosphatase
MTPLLFDLDGTLIDSVPDVCACLNDVLTAEGLAPTDRDRTQALVGLGARYLVAELLRERGVDPDRSADRVQGLLGGFLEIYAANPCRHAAVYPGVFDVLNAYRDQGRPMAICTNKPWKTTEPVLAAMNLADYFVTVACPDHVAHRKPDGRHLHETVARMGRAGASAIMIGDSENDVFAAADAGFPSICVTFGYCHVPFAELPARAFVDAFADVPAAVAAIEKTGA